MGVERSLERWQKDFEFEHKGFSFAGFMRPQTEIGGHNPEREQELIENCIRKIGDVFGSPNKFERRLARHERVPLDNPQSKRIHYNIILSDDPEYYCAGSGGLGGAKAFWAPYTTENEELRKKQAWDSMCDSCKTVAHESQHAIGSNAEFDYMSELPAIYNRIEKFPPGQRLEFDISVKASIALGGCKKGYKEPYERTARNMLCAINERYPEALNDILKSQGFSDESINEVLSCACK